MTDVQEWNGKNRYPQLKSVLDYAQIVEKRDDYKKGELYDYLVSAEFLFQSIIYVQFIQ